MLYGIDTALKIKAEMTTIKLIILFKITASSGGNLNKPINTGSLNSAPPKPIRPPRVPITEPDIKA